MKRNEKDTSSLHTWPGRLDANSQVVQKLLPEHKHKKLQDKLQRWVMAAADTLRRFMFCVLDIARHYSMQFCHVLPGLVVSSFLGADKLSALWPLCIKVRASTAYCAALLCSSGKGVLQLHFWKSLKVNTPVLSQANIAVWSSTSRSGQIYFSIFFIE